VLGTQRGKEHNVADGLDVGHLGSLEFNDHLRPITVPVGLLPGGQVGQNPAIEPGEAVEIVGNLKNGEFSSTGVKDVQNPERNRSRLAYTNYSVKDPTSYKIENGFDDEIGFKILFVANGKLDVPNSWIFWLTSLVSSIL